LSSQSPSLFLTMKPGDTISCLWTNNSWKSTEVQPGFPHKLEKTSSRRQDIQNAHFSGGF
jgi:hypothetical protein